MKLPPDVDFHSLRRTLITVLENVAGVDWVSMGRYVGHELPSMALKTYSGGKQRADQCDRR